MQHLETFLLIAGADRVLCRLTMFFTVFFTVILELLAVWVILKRFRKFSLKAHYYVYPAYLHRSKLIPLNNLNIVEFSS